MAAPPSVELLSFRRTFTRLILLVVLPSAGLLGFGIVGIVNERAAVEKRIELLWTGRLSTAQTELAEVFVQATVKATTPGLVLQRGDLELTDVGFSVESGEVKSDDARLVTALKPLGPELTALPERPVVFSVTSPQGTFLVAALRTGDRVSGAQVSARSIDTVLTGIGGRLTPTGEEGRFLLVPVKREAPEGMVARLTEAREAALAPRELAGLLMPSPLQDFRLVVVATGADPVVAASTRNRWIYSVLLGFFYILLALGVIFTGRTLSKETARLSGMIESVLDWSRIESGKKQYRRERIPTTALVDASVNAFKAQHLDLPPNLTVTLQPKLGEIEVDRDALSGALLNLLQNAFKYTGVEDKRIELRAVIDDDFVVLEVEDHGVGIPRREQKRIFDRFYRVDSLLTRDTEGSGLGLSIAQRIVQAHDGWISVDSVPGRGSTFRIHLPLAQ